MCSNVHCSARNDCLLFHDLYVGYWENPLLVSIATTVPIVVHLLVNSDDIALEIEK